MKNFHDIYSKVLETSKNDLEIHRKRVSKRIIFCIIGGIILFSIILGLPHSSISTFVLAIYLIISIVLIAKASSTYRKFYKSSVIKTFVKAYDEKLSYFPEKGIRKVYLF